MTKEQKYKHEWYLKNRLKLIELRKINCIINKEKIAKQVKSYYQKHKEEIKEYKKHWHKLHKERRSELMKQYYLDNRNKLLKQAKEYKKTHREIVNSNIRNKLRNDINFKLVHTLRCKLRKLIHKENRYNSALRLLDCPIDFLKKYLESKFTTGMSWKNYGFYGWHIDHIKPCASFDLSKPSEQRKCFHYTNLQPLWAKDNLSKGDK
jgi:hypothetical protein